MSMQQSKPNYNSGHNKAALINTLPDVSSISYEHFTIIRGVGARSRQGVTGL